MTDTDVYAEAAKNTVCKTRIRIICSIKNVVVGKFLSSFSSTIVPIDLNEKISK